MLYYLVCTTNYGIYYLPTFSQITLLLQYSLKKKKKNCAGSTARQTKIVKIDLWHYDFVSAV